MIKKRSIAACIILSIITCFIYPLYWIVVINDEVLMLADEEGTSGVMVLVLTIITCGIYGIYWCCKMSDRIQRMNEKNNISAKPNKALYVIFYLLGVVITLGMMQNSVNKAAAVQN